MNRSKKLYVYKMVVDNNGAPCVDDDLLSLAICKPRIRSTASECDWIFGFGGKSVPDLKDRLIYVAQVGKTLENGKYYDTNCEYRGRPDQIYHRGRDGSLKWKRGAAYHENGDIKDIGEHPLYKKARVLVCENFRYFGREAFWIHENNYRLTASLLENLRQGERVKHDVDLYDELLRLRDRVWNMYMQKRIGNPTHEPDPKIPCNTSEDDGPVEVTCP